ncbi:MAG: hypothetical protein LC772_01965, partial [Chloroflexi bacterium]|nr:hypothetical protein [Chloroflexota bacterium]
MSGRPLWLDRLAMPELTPQAFLLDASVRLLRTADDFAAFILQQREEIRTDGLTGMKAAERYTDVVDAALQRMLILAAESAGLPPGEEGSGGVAIVATGGYGRRELAPFSDVDVAFVPAREDDPGIDQVVRGFFRLMMDTARKAQLKVGYAYRLIAECASLELQTQTSLVDGRFIAGDFTLYCDFRDELRRQINPARFVFDKAWERSVARDAAGGTVYRVEPDLKNGAGGLRDIQTAMWLAQVRLGIWSRAVWEGLMDRGVV